MRYILILLFYFGLSVSSVHAATKFYDDLTVFSSASTNLHLTDFNGECDVTGAPDCIDTEFEFDGNTYRNSPDRAHAPQNLQICGPNALDCIGTLGGPFNSGLMMADGDKGHIRIELVEADAITAIGGLFGDINGPAGWGTVTVYDKDGEEYTRDVNYGSMAASLESERTFFGWTTDTVFTALEFTLVGGEPAIAAISLSIEGDTFWSAVDDVRFGQSLSQVPIPASIWLFGTALVGFVGMARRRKVA
jgi:hypothetical protein